jgi:hypothetical protein
MLEEGVCVIRQSIYISVGVCVNERTNVCVRRSCEVNKEEKKWVDE